MVMVVADVGPALDIVPAVSPACRASAKRGFSHDARLFSAGRSASLILERSAVLLCGAGRRALWKLLASRRADKGLALLGSARVVVLCPLGLALLPLGDLCCEGCEVDELLKHWQDLLGLRRAEELDARQDETIEHIVRARGLR